MDDLISRAAAIRAALRWYVNPDGGVFNAIKANIRSNLEQVPAADAVPVVQGEWVEEPDRMGHYHCSKCGVVWGIAAKAMKYCPNCATKMMNSPIWEVEEEAAVEMAEYCERYEPTYNPEDGSM